MPGDGGRHPLASPVVSEAPPAAVVCSGCSDTEYSGNKNITETNEVSTKLTTAVVVTTTAGSNSSCYCCSTGRCYNLY